MSQRDLVSAQTSNVGITSHAALNAIAYVVCDVTSSTFSWYIHPKGENIMAVCGFGCKKFLRGSLHKWSWKTVTGPPCNVQVGFISQSWLALPKQLDHKCPQNDRVQSYVQPGAGRPICIGFGYQLNV